MADKNHSGLHELTVVNESKQFSKLENAVAEITSSAFGLTEDAKELVPLAKLINQGVNYKRIQNRNGYISHVWNKFGRTLILGPTHFVNEGLKGVDDIFAMFCLMGLQFCAISWSVIASPLYLSGVGLGYLHHKSNKSEGENLGENISHFVEQCSQIENQVELSADQGYRTMSQISPKFIQYKELESYSQSGTESSHST